MKHIIDVEGAKWFHLETLQEAKDDAAHTMAAGADRFWRFTERGGSFYVLRDEQNLTILTTLNFGDGTIESKPTDGRFSDFMAKALPSLAAAICVDDPNFLNHGKVLEVSDFEP